MSNRLRAGVLAVVAATAALLALALTPLLDSTPDAFQIAVFIGVDDASWDNFVEGVRLAAKDRETRVSDETRSVTVNLSSRPVTFQWYKKSGSLNLRWQVNELCRQTHPPLAVIGANNSSMTDVLAHELAGKTPVLLMTTGTADFLIDENPRSFRFGFNNSYQAATVVERLKQWYREREINDPNVHAVVVEIKDDPFAVDLAERFLHALSPLAVFASDPGAEGAGEHVVWSLKTATGAFEDPNPEESQFARKLVNSIAEKPGDQWVLALPMGTSSFRRVSHALTKAFAEHADPELVKRARENLVILTGDSMSYYSFFDSARNKLYAETTPAPVILFAHHNPVDSSVLPPPNANIPERGLNRLVARTLLDVLQDAKADLTPEEFSNALADFRFGDTQLFRNRERYQDGGAVVVIPAGDHFEFKLPKRWQDR